MGAPQQLPAELSQCIDRCAGALRELPRLKEEVGALKQAGSDLATFASALFELELARQGDVESRMNISELAEVLLVFWSDSSGDAIARLHPALEAQWAAVAPMLVQFELRRLEMALGMCWKHRKDPAQLALDIEDLRPPGNRRVEFARCLYHLELARQGVQPSRAEFARRAGLLSDAYQDEAFAKDLVGADAGLTQLWGDLRPYLDEFFEAMEEQAARAMEGTRKVPMPVAPPESSRAEAKTDPSGTGQVAALGSRATAAPRPVGAPAPLSQPAIAAAFGVPLLADDSDLDEPRPSDVTVRATIPSELLSEAADPLPPAPPPPPPPRIAPATSTRPASAANIPSFQSLFSDLSLATPPEEQPSLDGADALPPRPEAEPVPLGVDVGLLTPPAGEPVLDLGAEPPRPTPPAGEAPVSLFAEPARPNLPEDEPVLDLGPELELPAQPADEAPVPLGVEPMLPTPPGGAFSLPGLEDDELVLPSEAPQLSLGAEAARATPPGGEQVQSLEAEPGPSVLPPAFAEADDADVLVELSVDPPPLPPAPTAPDDEVLDVAVDAEVSAPAPEEAVAAQDVEILETDFEYPAPPPPPPPSVTPASGIPVVVPEEILDFDFEPDEATLQFWDYTFAALQQVPVEGVKPRMLASESRQDRKRLTTWLDGLGPHQAVPEAMAMGALVRLMLAGETKEKSLFGQANPRRKEALQAAFAMLSGDPAAAGKVTEWFVLDGAETEAALMRGLELLYPFLGWCARSGADPLRPEAVAAYLEQA